MGYLEILERFPPELRGPISDLIEAVEERIIRRIGVTKEDFSRLESIVEQLAQAQKRTEEEVERLSREVTRLSREVDRLSKEVENLSESVRELAEMHKRFERTFESKLGALGARWGLATEMAFKNAIREMLKEVGYDAQGYLEFDQEGFVFGRPDQVELDVVLKDDKLILIEIKSSLSWEEVHTFQRKVEFYERKEGRRADRKIIIAPFVEGERPFEVA
ncbi:hypothetical protein DRP77_07285, partial [Candidatus Poribacteria bacterium]